MPANPDTTNRTRPDNPDNPDMGPDPKPGQSGQMPLGMSGLSGLTGCPGVRPAIDHDAPEAAAMAAHYAAPANPTAYRPGDPDALRCGLLIGARARQ